MSKDRDMKKDTVYLEELNEAHKETVKLRNERDTLVVKYYLMEQEARKYETIVFQLRDYVQCLLNEPTHKSYGGTLAEIRDILEGRCDD